VGTLGAVLVYHRKDIGAQIMALKPEGDPARREEVKHIVLASIPTAILGLGLKMAGVEHLGPKAVATCLLATACLNESTRHTGGGKAELTHGKALAIGVVQGIAVLPGISRSGSTIAAGMALGLDPIRAASFSFLCSIPAVGGATLLLLKDLLEGTAPLGPTQIAVGVGVSFLVGMACLEFLMRQLREGSFRPWAVYCLLLALAVFAGGMGRAAS
jgi:undecaprenyl-diphosphatase